MCMQISRPGAAGPLFRSFVWRRFDLSDSRSSSFKEDEGAWKANNDGKVVNNQPQRVMDDRNGLGPQGGYIGRYENNNFTPYTKSILLRLQGNLTS